MHDANGTPLKVGDKVIIPGVIKQLEAQPDYCNVQVESTLARRPDGAKEHFGSINTGVLVKVSGDAVSLNL